MKTKTTYLAVWLGLFCVCLCFQTAFSQSQISGLVQETNQQALPGASVLLLNAADSSLVKGRLSAVNGAFRFEDISAGSYLLRVTMLGFADYQSTPFMIGETAENKTWPPISLSEGSTQINEVRIVAKKPLYEQKIDRMVINVANSSVNAGGNALQVLQRSPGVLVNKQSNSISMSGKSGVIIMINGKISRMPPDAILSMLEGMNADNIERIELIHTPPASFDAEGSAGIVNIVLKQSADEGLNGNYSVNAGYGKREKYGAGLNLNFRRKKVNLFGSYSYQFDHNPQVFQNYRGIYRDNNFLETDGSSKRAPDLSNQNVRFGADFQITPKTVVGFVGTYFERYWNMDAMSNIDNKINGAIDYKVLMHTKEINRWNSTTGNVNLAHQFSKTKSLSVDADYVYYKIHNPSNYDIQNVHSDGSTDDEKLKRISKETPIQIGVLKADYTQTIGKETQFEAGIKGARSLFDNDVRVEDRILENWIADPALTSRFKLNENVAAAYSSISFKQNAKTDFKLGLRYEYTSTNLGSVEQPNVVDRKYGSWFPSLFVSRKISENQQLNLSYSRRIARPGFTQLAPYLIFYDPSTVQGGNPSLQPSFIHAVRSDYRYKVLSVTVEYNRESPSIRDVPIVDVANNSHVLRPENIGITHTAYAMLNAPWQPTKWWEMQSTLFLVSQFFDAKFEGENLKIHSRFAGFNSTQSIKLPQKVSLEISGNFITSNRWGIFSYKSNGSLNIGLQKEFGPRWGKLNFNVNDIFASNNWYGTADQPELNVLVRSNYLQAERTFMLTWTNKFGNSKLKDARQRANGAAEEMRRL
jgi:hypothetical protein